MTTNRFVRLFSYDRVKDPGARLRLEYEPDFGNAILADENTHPEHVDNPDANHIETLESLQLTTSEVRWLATAATELADIMERQDDGDRAPRSESDHDAHGGRYVEPFDRGRP